MQSFRIEKPKSRKLIKPSKSYMLLFIPRPPTPISNSSPRPTPFFDQSRRAALAARPHPWIPAAAAAHMNFPLIGRRVNVNPDPHHFFRGGGRTILVIVRPPIRLYTYSLNPWFGCPRTAEFRDRTNVRDYYSRTNVQHYNRRHDG
jgi:hypothetical protein